MTTETRKELVKKLVQDWQNLNQLSNMIEFNQKVFKEASDKWAKEWARLSGEEQGLCSELISTNVGKNG